MVCNEVLHGAGHRILQAVAANEVVSELVLGSVGGAAIDDGHGAIEVRLDGRRRAVAMCGHVEGGAARWGRAESRELSPAGGSRLPEQRKRREEERSEQLTEPRWCSCIRRGELTVEGEGRVETKAEE